MKNILEKFDALKLIYKGRVIKRLLLAGFLFTLLSCVGKEGLNQNDIISFHRATPSDDSGGPSYFTIQNNGDIYVAWDDDVIEGLPSESKLLNLSNLLSEELPNARSLVYSNYQQDLILVFEAYNAVAGQIKIARYDNEDFKLIWSLNLFGFNRGMPIIKEDYLYVSSIGTIGKIDLETGDYVWIHDDLYEYETHNFNSFEEPYFEGDKVIFQSESPYFDCRKGLEVDDANGSILDIIEICPED